MQVEERRAHLEKYLQGICQDPGIASSSIFVGFFLNAQKVYVITVIIVLKEKVTPKSIFFLSSPIKSLY